MKIHKFEDLLKKQLSDKAFKTEYEALDAEFTLAKEVIALRKKQKITQKELAERMKTSQPAIARIESGSYKNLSLRVINKLAKALGAKPVIHLKATR